MAGLQAPADRIAPVAPSPSLLTAARDRTKDGFGIGDAWSRTGVKWNSGACTRSLARKDACNEGDMAHGALAGLVAVDNLFVVTPIECDWTTMASEDSLRGLVEELNDAHSAYVMSRALWMGEGLAAVTTDTTGDYSNVTVNPTLRSAAVDLSLETGAQPIEEAVPALIAAWRECTGGNGMPTLHVPEIAVPYLFGGGSGGGKFLERQGDALVVPSVGARLSPGPGYPDGPSTAGATGYGPATGGGNYAGNANNELWVYITGPVEYARTDPFLVTSQNMPTSAGGPQAQTVDPADYMRQNRYESIAQSQALVRFDPCCVLAQLVQNPVGPVS